MAIDHPRVRDVVSGIYQIRRELPARPRTMQIWSDGKIYPVVVIPRGDERRRVDGRKIDTLHYSVRGYESRSGRRWKGSLELWLARDAAATPVEMHIERSLANLRLELHAAAGRPALISSPRFAETSPEMHVSCRIVLGRSRAPRGPIPPMPRIRRKTSMIQSLKLQRWSLCLLLVAFVALPLAGCKATEPKQDEAMSRDEMAPATEMTTESPWRRRSPPWPPFHRRRHRRRHRRLHQRGRRGARGRRPARRRGRRHARLPHP